jgi:hypothetical protein
VRRTSRLLAKSGRPRGFLQRIAEIGSEAILLRRQFQFQTVTE